VLSTSSTNAVENQAIANEFEEVAYINSASTPPANVEFVGTGNIEDGAVTNDKVDLDPQSIGIQSGIEVYYYIVSGITFVTVHTTTSGSFQVNANSSINLGSLPSNAKPKGQGFFLSSVVLATDQLLTGLVVAVAADGTIQVQNKTASNLTFTRAHASGFFPTSSIV